MALSKSVNSYGTVAEADAYFEDRLDAAAWTQASPDQKAQALVTASSQFDLLEWLSYAVSDVQPQAFPRVGHYLDPRLGRPVPMDPVPERLIKAVFEQAYHLLNNDGLLDDTGSVQNLDIAGVTLTKIQAAQKLPKIVRDLIGPMLLRGSNNRTWWRAN